MKEMIKDFLIWLISDPVVFVPLGLAGFTVIFFIATFIMIKKRDKRGIVIPGAKASDLVRSGAIPGVTWPEPSPPAPPGSMITGPGMRGSVTRMIFVSGTGKSVDLTDHVKSVTFEPETRDGETRPIEVTSDGEATRTTPEREHGSEHDPDRDRARADRRTNAARRSRARRRSPRRER